MPSATARRSDERGLGRRVAGEAQAAAAKAESALPAASVAEFDPRRWIRRAPPCAYYRRVPRAGAEPPPVAGRGRSRKNRPWPPPAPRRARWEDVPEEDAVSDDPPLDPHAVRRRLQVERAKRHALHEHQREKRLGGIRFLALIGILIFLTLFLSLSIWETIAWCSGSNRGERAES